MTEIDRIFPELSGIGGGRLTEEQEATEMDLNFPLEGTASLELPNEVADTDLN